MKLIELVEYPEEEVLGTLIPAYMYAKVEIDGQVCHVGINELMSLKEATEYIEANLEEIKADVARATQRVAKIYLK